MIMDKLTLIKALLDDKDCAGSNGAPGIPFEVGKNYHIQTILPYITGQCVAVTPQFVSITDGAWIADTGRAAEYYEKEEPAECEPWPNGQVIHIGIGAIVLAWEKRTPLRRSQK